MRSALRRAVLQIGLVSLPGCAFTKHEKIVGRIHTTNVLARERMDTVKDAELCVPSVLAAAR
jgi:hypothetical protein